MRHARAIVGNRFVSGLVLLALITGAARGEIIIQGGPVPANLLDAAMKKVVPKAVRGAEGDETEKPAATIPQADSVKFFNGDVLRGSLVAVSGGALRWKSPEAKGEIEFVLKNLSKVTLPRGKAGPAPGGASVVARLVNGDELMGELKSLDGEKVVLETWYAGALTLERGKVASLQMAKSTGGAIFEGPTGMDGWETGRMNKRTGWKFENGMFTTVRPGTIARDVKLPTMAHIQFDLMWRNQLQFAMNLFTDSLEEYHNNNSYMMQFNSGYLYMQRMRKGGGSSNMGNVEVQTMQTKNKVHVDFYVNKDAKSLALAIDGTVVKTWKESGEWAGAGTGLLFYQQAMGHVKLGNIKVTEWDGKLEDRSAATGPSKEDLAELANRDKISGTLKGIEGGKMKFETAFATMDIPLEKVVTVTLAGEKSGKMEKKPGEVRGVFAGRGAVTFDLEKWENGQVTGTGGAFGRVKFDAAAFNGILFNLDQQKSATSGESEEGDEGMDQ